MQTDYTALKTSFEHRAKLSDDEKAQNERRFDELFSSRNRTAETLTELTTTIKMLCNTMDSKFSTLDKQLDKLDKKIDEIKAR